MDNYIKIYEDNYKTVLEKYIPLPKKDLVYQSEADLEKELIQNLCNQGYEYLNIHDLHGLKENLRKQIERLNKIKFTNETWEKFYKEHIIQENDDSIVAKTRNIQVDYQKYFLYDPHYPEKNILLIDKENPINNHLQVINQLNVNSNVKNRYDVTILVNGLPLVHIELKARGRNIKEAFNQIERYQRESFWADDGLYEYIQIFIISNGTQTLYYSNTTRWNIKKNNETFNESQKEKTSNSFEFTIAWADQQNNGINDLRDFTVTFLASRTLLNILTRYCIFNIENKLIVMRPYQIAAAENILYRVVLANNNKWQGTVKAGGYIWHTTGSGKTLTSFKTAHLASNLQFIDKVMFVVDRKDLYLQTIKEYEKFDKDIFKGSKDTKELQRQLENPNTKIIVTSIQKLSRFVNANKNHEVYNKNIVIIFDECHRSQFGTMHLEITKNFKNYFLFGFTGTPIFLENLNINNSINPKNLKVKPVARTTSELFGDLLHVYTIKEALRDKKVLPFSIEYWQTMKTKDKDKVEDDWVNDIATEPVLLDDKRISLVVSTVLSSFQAKTKQGHYYDLKLLRNERNKKQTKIETERRNGFNSIFACWSIKALRKYYEEFKRQINNSDNEFIRSLKIATIFSYDPNPNENQFIGDLAEETVDDINWNKFVDKDFLLHSIDDYNKMFGTNLSTSTTNWFYDYYLKISEAVRNKEIDILLVVNMFLTGFDAPTLNTLWVDKNLEMHGLIQAFSRTNRIFDETKNAGNIVSFRNLSNKVEKSIQIFSNEKMAKDALNVVLLRTFKDYYYGYINDKNEGVKGYKDLATEFLDLYPVDMDLINNVITDEDKKEFIVKLNKILKLENVLVCFSEFDDDKVIIKDRPKQNYLGFYQKVHEDIINKQIQDKASIYDDVEFEMKIIKTQEYSLDEIIYLIKRYAFELQETKELIIKELKPLIEANSMPKSKKELLFKFIESLNGYLDDDADNAFEDFIKSEYDEDLKRIIIEYSLNSGETKKYMSECFRKQELIMGGVQRRKIFPKRNIFKEKEDYDIKEFKIQSALADLFNKYILLYER